MSDLAARYGAWTVIGASDPLGRRVVCRCACGETRTIAREALEAGDSLGCGCRLTPPRPKAAAQATPASPFSNSIAGIERLGARGRHHGRTG
jgi:hypothetical protein